MNPFVVPTLEEAAQYEKAVDLLGDGHRAAEICTLTGLHADTVKNIVADVRGTRAAITRARAAGASVRADTASAARTGSRSTRSVQQTPVRGVPEPPRTTDVAPITFRPSPEPAATTDDSAETVAGLLTWAATASAGIARKATKVQALIDELRESHAEQARARAADVEAEQERERARIAVEETRRAYEQAIEMAKGAGVKVKQSDAWTSERRAAQRVRAITAQHGRGQHAKKPHAECTTCASESGQVAHAG